mgnify:CR=1 FL=1
MKLSEYRDDVIKEYPNAFVESTPIGRKSFYTVFEDSSRSVTLGGGKTPLMAWAMAFTNEFGNLNEDWQDEF